MSRRSPLLPIFLIVLVDIFGLTLILPLLAPYAEHYGASPLQATLLVSVFAFCSLVAAPILGQVSDRVGRKPMLVVSQIGTFIGFLVMARATTLWMLYLSRVIDGATAGNLSLAQAYISDNTAPKDRAKSFALIGIAFGLGFFVGPFLSGYLAKFGLATPVYAAAAMSATSVLCTLTLLPASSPRPSPPGDAPGGQRLGVLQWQVYAQYFRRPVLGGLLLQFFFYIFAFSTFTSGFSLFAERRFTWNGHPFTPTEIGYVFAYIGLLGIILQGGLIGRLVKRFGEPALITAGFVTLVISYIALGAAASVLALVVVATVSSFGNGVLRPALTSLVSQAAGPHEQGVVLGLNGSLNSVAQIFAPMLGGYLIGNHELGWWAWVAGVASLFGLVAKRWGSDVALAPTSPTVDGAEALGRVATTVAVDPRAANLRGPEQERDRHDVR